ncbi:inositol monophosphatase [Halomonas campisalis]|uniref:Inositol-1-monophosphatase n=1 Tax=Billgrantia campisalis TaxID=74661 RepID=A0ABS9P5K9_9GAMM|nr:inositol monophosphatase family protein [Halomonas campisalis]MCG6657066.1 inositol monophosphatase [Halomonas campisalis]MDR5862251.1 inositol monophosphatase family protein [Halomonas campisalis]
MTPQQRLELAVSIAKEAGECIIDARHRQVFGQRYKYGQELVTDVDLEVDTLIGDRLEASLPGETRLSEELAPDREVLSRAADLWVIDPIDGTVNFAHGLHHVGVSIAWFSEGKTRLGVVHAPFLGETFSALLGQGAWCNDQPIHASRTTDLQRCLVGTGFPYRRDSRPPLIRRLMAVLTHCQDVRRNGSAALDLCDVACGRLDAYYESVSPWDFAAGWLIAREAGAQTGHLYPCPTGIPEDLYGENLLVAGPEIHAELGELLRAADANELDIR